MRIAVLTDSNSGMTPEDARENGIELMSMPIFIKGKSYMENVDITQEQFYEYLRQDANVSTSQPSVGEMQDEFDRLLKSYDSIVFIPMSAGLSGTCQTAAMLAQDYDGKVQVVNNHRISVTQRQSALDAKLLADKGADPVEIREKLEADAGNSSIYIMVGSLDYLKRGGRVTPAATLLGGLLRIRPILQIQGEKLDAFAKARSLKAAKKIMFDALHKDLDGRFKPFVDKKEMEVYISYTHGQPEQVKQWFEEVKTEFSDFNVTQDPLSLSISCHTGPGCLGIGCARKVV